MGSAPHADRISSRSDHTGPRGYTSTAKWDARWTLNRLPAKAGPTPNGMDVRPIAPSGLELSMGTASYIADNLAGSYSVLAYFTNNNWQSIEFLKGRMIHNSKNY